MESGRSQKIWEIGEPLFNELNRRVLSENSASKPKTFSGVAGNIDTFFRYVHGLVKPDAEHKLSIVRDVSCSVFAVTGRRKLPTQSRGAVRIQARDFESGDVSWASSSVANGKFLYDAVRLTRISELPTRLAVSHPNASHRLAGLDALIAELYSTSAIKSNSNKINVSLIKKEIIRRDISFGGMSDENIRRRLRYFIRRLI